MQPRSATAREVGHLGQRIEIAGVHVTRGRDQDRRLSTQSLEGSSKRVEVEASRGVATQGLRLPAANSKHPQRLDRAGVEVAAREHRHGWQSGKPLEVDVHLMLQYPPSPGGRQ